MTFLFVAFVVFISKANATRVQTLGLLTTKMDPLISASHETSNNVTLVAMTRRKIQRTALEHKAQTMFTE